MNRIVNWRSIFICYRKTFANFAIIIGHVNTRTARGKNYRFFFKFHVSVIDHLWVNLRLSLYGSGYSVLIPLHSFQESFSGIGLRLAKKCLEGLLLARHMPKPQTKKFNPAKMIIYSSWAEKCIFKTPIFILINYNFFGLRFLCFRVAIVLNRGF